METMKVKPPCIKCNSNTKRKLKIKGVTICLDCFKLIKSNSIEDIKNYLEI